MPLAEEATCRTGTNIGKPLAITVRGFPFPALWDNSKMRASATDARLSG